jgi:hypothetical protein
MPDDNFIMILSRWECILLICLLDFNNNQAYISEGS